MQRIRIMVDDEPRPAVYFLTDRQGKAVQEVLNRYLSLLRAETDALKASGVLDAEDLEWQVRKDNADTEYIADLAKLFD